MLQVEHSAKFTVGLLFRFGPYGARVYEDKVRASWIICWVEIGVHQELSQVVGVVRIHLAAHGGYVIMSFQPETPEKFRITPVSFGVGYRFKFEKELHVIGVSTNSNV
jgi:hypothetical protein